jgi:nitrogen fixation protein NifU and related proteins
MINNRFNNDEMRDLYRELILDHARSPRHFGKLTNASHQAEGINPLCGDKLKLYFRIGPGKQIEEATFEGSGCAISVASASLMTETVIGLTTDQALQYFYDLTALLTGKISSAIEPHPDLGKLKALEGVKEFPSRVKCATLAWHALNSAVTNDHQTVSTE